MYAGELVGNNGSYSVVIYRMIGGVPTPIASAPASAGSGILRLEVIGNVLQLYLNGALLTATLDGTIEGPGLAGVLGTSAGLDNFVVQAHG